MPRTPQPPESSRLRAEFDRATVGAAPHRRGSDARLVDAVRALDAHARLAAGAGLTDDAGLTEHALRRLAGAGDTLLFLDQALRRGAVVRYVPGADPGAAGQAGFWAAPTPLGLALASCHPDGRVRERAVRRIAAVLTRGEAPAGLVAFLAVRTGDWAPAVRDRARGALAVLLDAHPARLVPSAVPAAESMARRLRGGFARQQVRAVLTAEGGTAVLDALASSPDERLRRFALPTAIAAGRIRLTRLAAIAGADPDRRCRLPAGQAAVREAVWTEQLDVLRRLTAAADPDVRALAVTGLVRAGHPEEAVQHLADRASLVRATAREAARRTGVDAAAWYRTVLASAPPPAPGTPAAPADLTPGVLAGLAETGRPADAALLLPLLTHPWHRLRAAAARALRHLDAVPVADVLPLLRDDFGSVVREAAAALSTRAAQLPPGLGESMLADPRAAVRRAGLRLLAEADPVRRLTLLLRAAADPEPRLSRRAAEAAARLVREVRPSNRERRLAPPLPFAATRAQARELAELAVTARFEARHPGEHRALLDTLAQLPGQRRDVTSRRRGARPTG